MGKWQKVSFDLEFIFWTHQVEYELILFNSLYNCTMFKIGERQRQRSRETDRNKQTKTDRETKKTIPNF